MNKMTRVVLTICLVIVCITTFAEGTKKMNRESALKVLEHYLGTWEIVIDTEGSPLTGGEYTAEWVLDGSFVEKTGYLSSGDDADEMETTTWMTVDEDAGVYRMWSFMSGGTASEAEATWDPETRTMTDIRRHDGMTFTTKTTFVGRDIQKWAMETMDGEGNVVHRLQGTNKRLNP